MSSKVFVEDRDGLQRGSECLQLTGRRRREKRSKEFGFGLNWLEGKGGDGGSSSWREEMIEDDKEGDNNGSLR
ncbi:hypothetical protein ACH5RR_001009 [Cinchona calisaya]|uniref:Uncharacterized protein n=1 Tax=Cinchona calisaya TaxID=153742 RepID=A0ABD3B2U3_9GENT